MRDSRGSRNDLAGQILVEYAFEMTAVEIINEIKRLPPAERARVARMFGELNRPLSGKELGDLAGMLAGESDPDRARALKEQITAGFYGGERNA
jgi:hypothetical protein